MPHVRRGLRRRRLPVTKSAAIIAVSLVAVSCGTTVDVGEGQGGIPSAGFGPGGSASSDDNGMTFDPPVESQGGDGSVAPEDGTDVAAAQPPSTRPNAQAPGSTPNTPPPTAGPPSGVPSDPPATTTAPPRYGPGVNDEEIVIGIPIPDEATANGNQTQLGAEGVTQGNVERYYDIMGADMNARGGIAGRDVRFSKFHYSTADGQAYAQLEQASCTHWTQDDPAFIAYPVLTRDTFLGCAKDAGMVTWSSTLTSLDDVRLANFPTHIELSAMSLTRQSRLLADGLEHTAYFDDGYKLGVVTYDGPQWVRAVDESLEPTLQANGREITEKAFLRELQSSADLGDLTAQIQSTVLRFKTQGITHVSFIDESGGIALLFMRSAENQAYRPRYGLTSQAGGMVLAGVVPHEQLARSVGIGWLPAFDVPASERPEDPAAEQCLARFAEHGEEPADANNRGIMLSICENLEFIRAAVERGLPDITATSFVAGAESLGAFTSFNSFGNYLAPGRHDGASHYRTVAWDTDCACFHYTSDLIPDLT